MARDTLGTLLRVRRLAVEETARALGAANKDGDAARAALADLRAAMVREQAVMTVAAADDPARAAFVLWQAAARRELVRLEMCVAQADEVIAAAQAALGAARGGARAVEAALERRRVAADMDAARAAQHELEDVVRGRVR